MSGQGRVYRRCACRDETGRQLGQGCPQLATDSRHGRWYFAVDVPSVDGRRRTQRRGGFPTKVAARRALDELTARSRDGIKLDDRETVAVFLTRWLEVKGREAKPSTMRSYREHVERILVPELGHLALERLRAEHVERLLTAMLESGRGLPTVRRVHATLRSALGYAVKTRRLDRNAAAGVPLPTVRRPEVQPWSAAELAGFLRHSSTDRLGPVYEVIAACGLRRGETLGLRWADVDLTRRVMHVRQTLTDVGGHLTFGTPKTRASEASVPLTDRAVGALLERQLQRDTEHEQWGEAYADHGLVFARENGEPLRPEWVTRRFRELAETAGLRRIRLHDLRHGAASLMLAAGVPMAIVSKMLRHSSIGITVDTYGHLSEDTARAASDAIGQLLDAAFADSPGAARDHTATTSADPGPGDDNAAPPMKGETAGQEPVSGGAAYRNRTDDLLITSEPLCRLS